MVTFCFKYGICAPLGAIGTATTLGVVADTIHVAAGGGPVVIPWVARHWKEVYKDIYGVYPSTEMARQVEADISVSDSATSRAAAVFTESEAHEYETLNDQQKIIFRQEVKQAFIKAKETYNITKKD